MAAIPTTAITAGIRIMEAAITIALAGVTVTTGATAITGIAVTMAIATTIGTTGVTANYHSADLRHSR